MALAFVSLQLWQAWQDDYVHPRQQATKTEGQANAAQGDAAIPQVTTAKAGALPDTPTTVAQPKAAAAHGLVHVLTDKLDLKIDPRGATIVEAHLMDFPVSVEQKDVKVRLLSEDPKDFFIAQSGLLSADKARAPTHQALFSSAHTEYRMASGADSLDVDFTWTSPDGVKVTKRYRFHRGTHAFELDQIVENDSTTPWTGREYRQLQRGEPQVKKGPGMMYTFTGGAIYSPEDKYHKIKFDKLAEGEPNIDVKDGWIAMIQHYFLAAFVPPRGETEHFYGKKVAEKRYVLGSYTPPRQVAPGQKATFSGKVFIGPKSTQELPSVAEGLDLTVDYGWLVFLAKPIHWILDQIYAFVGNWGWTIIIFTILIKAVFFKLSETSYRSMANMRKLGPRIQALKDRYGDDKQRMQQAMMEIYKKEKINPLGGCLPMLVQIPFFIALYWVLLENVEMRQAPWILWIKDLSIKDPYFVLPIIMAVSMFVQQKLNPAPPDPMQAKIMSFLPLVFGFMFAFFPAGLVIYWVTNNILSITQQWLITRRIEQGAKA
jgi:YidC/Oxa1 family membrane protein insertase